MKDILELYNQSNAFSKCFEAFEHEVIKYFGVVAKEKGVFILLSNKIHQRLMNLHPEIATYKNIFTYKLSMKDLYKDSHPMRAIYSKEAIKHLVENKINNKNLSKADRSLILVLDCTNGRKDFTGMYALEASVAFNDETQFSKTKAAIDENLFGWTVSRLSKYYLTVSSLNLINDKSALAMTATDLGIVGSRTYYQQHIESMTNAILFSASSENHVLGVFLDIATMTNFQLDYFVSGYYSTIPFTGKRLSPTAAVAITKTVQDNPWSEAHLIEYYIKGLGCVVHIVYDYDKGIQTYDCYDTTENETIEILGENYLIDDDFLTGMNLDLFAMVTVYYDNIKIRTDFTFDYEKSYTVSLTQQKDEGLHEYLLDMVGRYHRLKMP